MSEQQITQEIPHPVISEYFIPSERKLGKETVHKTTFSLDYIKQAAIVNPEILSLFPNISEIRKTIRNEHFFEDYCFSAHIPQDTLDLINESLRQAGQKEISGSLTQEKMLIALRYAMSNPKILKHINVHGWSAAKEIWEIDEENGNSWTAEQIKQSQKEGQHCFVLNFDSNGWGKTSFTDTAKEILEKGPYLLMYHRGQITKATIEELLKRQAEEALESKAAAKEQDRYKQTRDWLKDPFFRAFMPGAVNHAAATKWFILNDLFAIDGPRIYWGHSQGGKIINRILATHDNSPDTIGVSLAAAQTERILSGDELRNFFSLLGLLENQLLMDFSTRLGLAEITKKEIMRFFAAGGLPKKIQEAVLQIHLNNVEKGREDQLITQAHTWAYDSDEQRNPRVLEYSGGKSDKLIPWKRFKAWSHMPQIPEGFSRGLERFSFPNPALEDQVAKVFNGGHYFHLLPQNQLAIIREAIGAARYVFSSPEEIRYCLHEIRDKGSVFYERQRRREKLPIKFAVVPDGHESVTIPLGQRVDETIERGRRYDQLMGDKDQELPVFPPLIPITQQEMMAIIATQAKMGVSGIIPSPESTFEAFIRKPENVELKNRLGELNLTEETGIIMDEHVLRLIDHRFPYDFYLTGIIPEENLEKDIGKWVDYQKLRFDKDHLTALKEAILQIYLTEKARLEKAGCLS